MPTGRQIKSIKSPLVRILLSATGHNGTLLLMVVVVTQPPHMAGVVHRRAGKGALCPEPESSPQEPPFWADRGEQLIYEKLGRAKSRGERRFDAPTQDTTCEKHRTRSQEGKGDGDVRRRV